MTAFRKLSAVVIALAALVATARHVPAQGAAEAVMPALKLLAEGDRLADKKDYATAVLRYKDAYEQLVPELRGRKFLEAVKPQLMTRDELKKHMAKLVAEDYSDDELHEADSMLKAFRLAPPDLDLKATMTALLTEEVGGFYNPKDKAMVLIREGGDEPKKKKGLFERIFGGEEEFDKDSTKITLAHEMTHALQDQHFDLQALDRAVEHDDDMALALTSLVEGEATLVMFAEMLRGDGEPKEALKFPPERMDAAFSVLRALTPFASGKTFQKAPLLLRESLIFPYHKGTVFLLHLTNHSEWKLVDQAFRTPPVSTEQILHPEKFYEKAKLDEPMVIELPSFRETLGKDWKQVSSNVLGEFQATILLADAPGASTHKAQVAAAGWDGDQFAVFENDAKQLGLVWLSTWDSRKDAEEFAAAYADRRDRSLAALAGKKKADNKPGGAKQPSGRSDQRLERDGRVFLVDRKGDDVAVIEGFSPQVTEKLLSQAFAAKKTVKRFTRKEATGKEKAGKPRR
jgi:hypothetical protein